MAAAAFSSSRATTGFTATRALFLIFTLLCLVCIASSLMDKNQLEKFKEELEELEKEGARLRAEFKSTMASNDKLISLMDQNMALTETQLKVFLPYFPHLHTYLERMKRFVEQTKTNTDKKYKEISVKMLNEEIKLEKLKNLIKFLEENHVEL